jgi:Fic family protein
MWQGRLRRDLEAQAVAASTSMEGIPVTVDEVRRVLAGDPSSGVRPGDVKLVRGYRDAMGFALRRADDLNFRWDRELLVGMHDRILAGDWGAGAGRFRTSTRRVANNQTGAIVFSPDWEAVPELVDQMCDALTEGFSHPAIAGAWAHLATAAIHPFGDGNGRAARVLASLAMFRGGFRRPEFTSLEEWWGRHISDYYAAFECLGPTFDPGADVTPFILAHVTAQLSQVRALDMRERVERRIFAAIIDLLPEMALAQRVANAVWDVFFGYTVTPGYYRSIVDVSAPTVSSDLAKAGAAGLLRPVGETRGRRYLAGSRLFPMIGRALDVEVGTLDPDTARAVIISEITKRVSESDADRARLTGLAVTPTRTT